MCVCVSFMQQWVGGEQRVVFPNARPLPSNPFYTFINSARISHPMFIIILCLCLRIEIMFQRVSLSLSRLRVRPLDPARFRFKNAHNMTWCALRASHTCGLCNSFCSSYIKCAYANVRDTRDLRGSMINDSLCSTLDTIKNYCCGNVMTNA
jgi:hypothetical protein